MNLMDTMRVPQKKYWLMFYERNAEARKKCIEFIIVSASYAILI